MNIPDSNPKPTRLIIDEDWKSQVERERHTLDQGPQTPDAEVSRSGELPGVEVVDANFELLASMLMTPALLALGQQFDPRHPPMPVDLPQARLYIDLLVILQQRTRGNLSAEEDQMLEAWINQLQMLFVNIQSRQQHSVKG